MNLNLHGTELQSHRQWQLLDMPKNELKQLKYMFEHKRIQFMDTLIDQIQKRTGQSPEDIKKLFGSYVNPEVITEEDGTTVVSQKQPQVTWEMFLQVLEEEVKYNDENDFKISYTSKNIYIKPPQRKNLSLNQTKFFFQSYQPTFFERLELRGEKCSLMLIDNQIMALLNEDMTKVHKRIDFSREFGKQFQGKLFEQNKVLACKEREDNLKKLRMSGLSSFVSSGKKERGNLAIDYDFDILLYAGIKKPNEKKSRRRKGDRKSKSYRLKGRQNTGFDVSSAFSDMDFDEATTSFGSESQSVTQSRASKSRNSRNFGAAKKSRFEQGDHDQANKSNLQNIGEITLNTPMQARIYQEGRSRKSPKSQIGGGKADLIPTIKEQKLHQMAHSGGFAKKNAFNRTKTKFAGNGNRTLASKSRGNNRGFRTQNNPPSRAKDKSSFSQNYQNQNVGDNIIDNTSMSSIPEMDKKKRFSKTGGAPNQMITGQSQKQDRNTNQSWKLGKTKLTSITQGAKKTPKIQRSARVGVNKRQSIRKSRAIANYAPQRQNHLLNIKSRSVRAQRTPTISKRASILQRKRGNDAASQHRYHRSRSKLNNTGYGTRSRRGSQRQSITSQLRRARMMRGLNEKAAIDNILIDLKNKLKKSNSVEPRRDSYNYTEKEGKEIHKMFEKFKIITQNPDEDMLETNYPQKYRQSKSMDPNHRLPTNSDDESDYFGDLSFDDLDEYQKKLSKRIQMKKIDDFMNQVKGFNKKANKFSKHLGHIQDIMQGDLSKIDPQYSYREKEVKRKFGEKIYNYSKYTGDSCDNNQKGTKLEVAGAYFWRDRGILFLSFLTRQMMTYEFEYNKTRQFKIHKMEEIISDEFFTEMHIMRSTLSHFTYFLLTVENFHKVKIFKFTQLEDRNCILKKNLLKANVRYSFGIGENTMINRCHMFFGGLCFCTLENDIFVVEQTGLEKFEVTNDVQIYKKFRSITISALCYGKSSALIMLGTTIGDFYVYDTDICQIVFTYRDSNCKIVDIKFFEGLKNIYIFWQNGKIKVLDSITYDILQETKGFKKVLKVVGPNTVEKQFVYMTNIDDILDNPLSTLDEKKISIVEKFSEKIAKPIRYNSLDRQILNGNICIVFGNSHFNLYNLQVRADKQFKQMVATYRKVNKELEMNKSRGNYSARVNFFNSVCNNTIEWKYCSLSKDGTKLLMINERKLVVYYDLKEEKIIKHFILDMHGELCRYTIENDGKEFLIANRYGRVIQYELKSAKKILEVKVPLTSVMWAEKLGTIYELCYFNNPNEVICLHKLKGISSSFEIDELILNKNMTAFRVRSNFLLVRPLNKYMMVLHENFKLGLFKRENMKPIKEYNLLEHFEDSDMKRAKGGMFYQYIVDVCYQNDILYLHYDEGNILILRFNEDRLSDMNVYLAKTHQNMKMCVNQEGENIFTLAEGMYLSQYEFQPHNDISLKELKKLRENKELMKVVSNAKKHNPALSSKDIRQMAAQKLGRTGTVLNKKDVHQLDSLFEDFKNELQRLKEEKIEANKAKNKQPAYLLSSILDNKPQKPKRRDINAIENYLPRFNDILKILHIPTLNKICIILKKGNFYLLDSSYKDLEIIRLSNKLKQRRRNVKKGGRTLKSLIQNRKNRQMLRDAEKAGIDIRDMSVKEQLRLSKESFFSSSKNTVNTTTTMNTSSRESLI